MDIMIPYLGKITQLTPQSKNPFYVAGVHKSAAKKRAEEQQHPATKVKKQNLKNDSEQQQTTDPDHLDTWA